MPKQPVRPKVVKPKDTIKEMYKAKQGYKTVVGKAIINSRRPRVTSEATILTRHTAPRRNLKV